MDIFLPKGFEAGRARRVSNGPQRVVNLCVEAGGVYYPVLRKWATGFAAVAAEVPALSGVVNLYDGAEHLHQCLITGVETVDGETIFTVKRSTGFDYSAVAEAEENAQART